MTALINDSRSAWIAALACLLVVSCGDGEGGVARAQVSDTDSASALEMAQAEPRSGDPRLLGARKALAAGQEASVRTQLDQLGGAAGVEGPLCEARLALWMGEVTEALAAVERARALAPSDSRVFATLAEIFAMVSRGADAEEELGLGLELAGPTPDIRRAQAVRMLFQAGRGPDALKLLLAAAAADPSLPYMDWPLSQAQLLTAGFELGQGHVDLAIDHALQALIHDSGLGAAHVILGDAYGNNLDFVAAIASYEDAAEAGADVKREQAAIHLRAGMAARLLQEHEAAIFYYLKARDFGLSDLEMSSGADYLKTRADLLLKMAGDVNVDGDFAGAEQLIEEALKLDPHNLHTLDFLGNVRFHQKDYDGAAIAWEILMSYENAAGEGGESATHLNRCRALVHGQRVDEAKAALEAYLESWPDGPHHEGTREMLGRLSGQ
jgi:tetratricopeptide (TPR) repeat protein